MALKEEFSRLSIGNVANGAAQELFKHALDEVLENVMDDNRAAESERTITLKFKIKPSRDRSSAGIRVQVETGLCPVQPTEALMFMRVENGKGVAYAQNIFQPELPFESDNVRPLGGADRAARNNE